MYNLSKPASEVSSTCAPSQVFDDEMPLSKSSATGESSGNAQGDNCDEEPADEAALRGLDMMMSGTSQVKSSNQAQKRCGQIVEKKGEDDMQSIRILTHTHTCIYMYKFKKYQPKRTLVNVVRYVSITCKLTQNRQLRCGRASSPLSRLMKLWEPWMGQLDQEKLPLSALTEEQRQRWRDFEALRTAVEAERLSQVSDKGGDDGSKQRVGCESVSKSSKPL